MQKKVLEPIGQNKNLNAVGSRVRKIHTNFHKATIHTTMQTKTKRVILTTSLALCSSVAGWAQDVIVDFKAEAQFTGKDETIAKGENVTFTFVGDVNKHGANIYGTDNWASVYYLTVSAPRNIAVIEYEVEISSNKTDDVNASVGNMNRLSDGIWVWKGPAQTVKFTGGSSSANFRITRARLWFDAKDYDHATAVWDNTPQGGGTGDGGETRPCQANIDFTNDATNYDAKDRVYAPVNILPRDGHGVPMAVVSDRKFQKTLQPYLEWKTQQGYEVQELYTDQVPSGLGRQEMALALRQRLIEMKPRPAYVLLVGDSQEVPVFYGITYEANHASDFYYGEFNDDHFADAYVGRFSARTPEDLQPQLDKTKYMATITPSEGEWLKHSITVNDISSDIKAMDKSAELSRYYPLNFEGNTTDEFHASWTSTINTNINNGCSFVSYFGHGTSAGWNNAYTTYNVNQLENRNKYPVVFSITCLTGYFDGIDCMAEAFMRKQESGAVAFIGASRNSYANTNNTLFLGRDGNGQQSSSLGMLHSLFPYVGTDPSQRARTIGQALDVGCVALAHTLPQSYIEVAEFYNLFGDPTYQPYITTPKANKLSASSYNITAGRNVVVTTVPDAMVCLSQGRRVIAAAMAGTDGKVVLHVPATATTGDCTLYTSAPGYNDLSRLVAINAGNGTEEQLDGTAKSTPLITHTDVISLETADGSIGDEWNAWLRVNGTESQAVYGINAVTEKSHWATFQLYNHWNSTSTEPAGFYLRNKYTDCGIVTTRTGGKARTVTADWLSPTGLNQVIGVYGRNTAYSSTSDAWNNPGEKLGELSNGDESTLVINGDYAYIAFRAEDHLEYPTLEQSNVYLRSLTIGWEATLPQCATPQIAFEGGKFSFSCTTRNATYNYGVAPAQGEKNKFVLTVTAEADGYKPSVPATLTIDASQLSKIRGDVDENGTLSITDVVKLIDSLNTKK